MISGTITRSITDGPRWRWSKAEELLMADRDKVASEGSSDYYVQLAYRVCKLSRTPAGRKWLRMKLPINYDVCYIGSNSRVCNTMRASLEACLLARLSPVEIAKKLTWLTPMHALLYSKWFFDLEGVDDVPAWVEDYIITPSRQSNNVDRRTVAILLASDGNLDEALEYVLTGRLPDMNLLKRFRKNERQKLITNYTVKGLRLPDNFAAPLLENIIKMDEDAERAREKDMADSGVTITEKDVDNLLSATEKYSDTQAVKYSTGTDGIENMPGMDDVRAMLSDNNPDNKDSK